MNSITGGSERFLQPAKLPLADQPPLGPLLQSVEGDDMQTIDFASPAEAFARRPVVMPGEGGTQRAPFVVITGHQHDRRTGLRQKAA